MHRCRLLDDAALLISSTGLAMLLHDVDSLDEHTASLRKNAKDLSFLTLVVAAHHTHRVALGDVKLYALGVDSMPSRVPLLAGLSVLQITHATKPPGPARRSSCTSSRGARAPRVRRYASR